MPNSTLKPPLAILIAVAAIGPAALNIFIPSMPGISRVMNVDYGVVQLTLTLYLFAVAFAQIFIGALSDRFGRRPVLLAGLTLFLAGSLLCASAPSIEMLILGRVIQATGGCAGIVLSRSIARDMHDHAGATKLVAHITMAMVVAPMIAPAIGGLLDEWYGWQGGFLAVGAAGAVTLAGAFRWLHETNFSRRSVPGIGAMIRDYAELLRSPRFLGYACNSAFSSGIFFAFLAGAPYIVVEILGRPASEYGFYFVLVSGGYMLGNYLAAKHSARLGSGRMLIIGNVMALTGATAFWIFHTVGHLSPLALFAPTGFIAIANGMSLPNSMVGAVSVNPAMAGTASGSLRVLADGHRRTFHRVGGLSPGRHGVSYHHRHDRLRAAGAGLAVAGARGAEMNGGGYPDPPDFTPSHCALL